MKKMKWVFGLLEKIYWVGFAATVLGAVFAFALLAWLAHFIAKQTGTEGGFFQGMSEYAAKNNDQVGQYIFSSTGLSHLVLIFAVAIVVAFLHAKTFTKLHRFVTAKMDGRSLSEQRQLLAPIPKYVIAAYLLDFILVVDKIPQYATPSTDSKIPEWVRQMGSVADMLFPKLLPSLGTPLGLIFALLIYFYCQSLEQTESLSQEAQKLREEADLII